MKGLRAFARVALMLGLTCGGLCAACGVSGSDMNASNGGADGDAGDGPRPRDDPTVPPTEGRAALTEWLAQRYYESWTCETTPQASPAAVHSRMRVCRNDALEHPPASGDYHVSAAAVADLLDASDTLIGHAVSVRVLPDAGATGWYFYESFMHGASAPLSLTLEPDGTLADGRGDAGGNAQTICAACHTSARRDFVYGAQAATQ